MIDKIKLLKRIQERKDELEVEITKLKTGYKQYEKGLCRAMEEESLNFQELIEEIENGEYENETR